MKFDTFIKGEIEEAKKRGRELADRLRDPFQKFIDIGRVKTEVKVKVENEISEYTKEFIGATLIEKISVWEKDNSLCNLCIERRFFYEPNCEYEGASSEYKIVLYWFDNDDKLEYETEYYPLMTNDVIYEKACLLMNTAIESVKIYRKYQNMD